MKNFSLSITMLCCFVVFGQESNNDFIQKERLPKKLAIFSPSTISKRDYPMYIIDGKIINEEEIKNLNPETIESIKIVNKKYLKFCPNRGIIVIKTKRTQKNEKDEN